MKNPELDSYNLLEISKSLPDYQFHYITQTPTTMRQAETYVRRGKKMPAIFLTDHQTEGRGREGRKWLDKEGASILVTGVLGIRDSTISTFADLVALQAAFVLRDVTLIDNVCIKYPNDLVINDKKVGGMLLVNHYHYNDELQYLGTSVGIGVNVHYSKRELLRYNPDYGATALDLHTPKPNSRQAILLALFERMRFLAVDAEVLTTNKQMQQNLNNRWRSLSSVYSRMVQVEADGDVLVKGRVVDTQIGEGILVEGSLKTRWFNQFNTKMKVRLLE